MLAETPGGLAGTPCEEGLLTLIASCLPDSRMTESSPRAPWVGQSRWAEEEARPGHF